MVDLHRASYSDSTGLSDFFKRFIWNRLPFRFRLLLHETSVLKTNVAALKARVPGLDTEVAALNAGIPTLHMEVAALNAWIPTLHAEVEALKVRIPFLDTEIANLKSQISNLDAKLSDLENVQHADLADNRAIQARLAAFEDRLPGITERLDSLNAGLSQLEEKSARTRRGLPKTDSVEAAVLSHSSNFEPGVPAFVYYSPSSFEDMAHANGVLKVSYAQNSEDIILARVFSGQEAGFYIDVGAAHPIGDSVTQYFYKLGWRGINIEPHPAFFEGLRSERQRDINLNVGLAARAGIGIFYDVTDCTGMSTFDREWAERLRSEGHPIVERYLPISTLAAVCESCVDGDIDFLKIDTEGGERGVIEGGDFRRFRPKIVVVEATEPGTEIPSWQTWEPLLEEKGYTFAYFDGLNRWYVRNENKELMDCFRLPPNIFDGFVSWKAIQAEWGLERFRQTLLDLASDMGLSAPGNVEKLLEQIVNHCKVRAMPKQLAGADDKED